MAPVGVALIVVFLLGLGVGIYALIAPRRARERVQKASRAPLAMDTSFNEATAAEFSSLGEAARCDMIFAVSALDDERSAALLEYALDDPSEAVVLAAARGLRERGRAPTVDAFLERHPGERAERIAKTLTLLAPEP